MKRSTWGNILSLVAGWIVVLYWQTHPVIIVPLTPYVFSLGAMSGITLVYIESSVVDWFKGRKAAPQYPPG